MGPKVIWRPSSAGYRRGAPAGGAPVAAGGWPAAVGWVPVAAVGGPAAASGLPVAGGGTPVAAGGTPVAACARAWLAAEVRVRGVMLAIEDLGKSEGRRDWLETC